MNTIIKFYNQQIEHFTRQKQKLEAKSKHFSILRLICFLALGVSVYQCFVSTYLQGQITLTVFFLIIFLFLIKKHDKIQKQKDWADRMLLINTNELDVLNNKPSIFDNGQSFFSTESYYYDLDVFGDGSMYHLLNRTGTSLGSSALAYQLKNQLLDIDTILQQQNAVKELTPNVDFRQQVLAAAISDKGKVSDLHEIEYWVNNNKTIAKKWWRYAIIIAPALFVISLVISILQKDYYLVSAVFTLNLAAAYYFSRGINVVHGKLSGTAKLLDQYAHIFQIINSNSFTSSKLSDFRGVSGNATKQLKQLSTIINFFDQRLNLLVAVFFNAIFFYDLHCVLQLEAWRKQNANNVEAWFTGLAQIEVLNSLATFAFNNPHYVVPNISVDKQIMRAKNLSHPLISPNKRVSNNVYFEQNSKVILITGSNMSGKSTFLRTVGVNMLLATCGASVCADEFSFYPVKLYGSLRQSDSLQDDTSFFYAELKKLSEIIKHLETGEQALVLLDEVLKGTNSDDKTYGSHQLILRLMRFNTLSLIASHDISLGKIADAAAGLVENYCFESLIENNELLFDYKLQKGIAVNKNATFLMKKMGIIDSN